jgi:hypothetical protein
MTEDPFAGPRPRFATASCWTPGPAGGAGRTMAGVFGFAIIPFSRQQVLSLQAPG